MYFEIYQDVASKWRWRLRAGNHEIIAHGQSYASKKSCEHAVELVKQSTLSTPVREL